MARPDSGTILQTYDLTSNHSNRRCLEEARPEEAPVRAGLGASALLARLQREPDAASGEAILGGALLSTVRFAGVARKAAGTAARLPGVWRSVVEGVRYMRGDQRHPHHRHLAQGSGGEAPHPRLPRPAHAPPRPVSRVRLGPPRAHPPEVTY